MSSETAAHSEPTVRTDWAGDRVRLIADTASISTEISVHVDAAERLVESLQLAIAGARRFEQARAAGTTQ